MNTTKTIMLTLGLTVLLVLVGGALGGRQGTIFAFVLSLVINGVSYWFSDKIVLKMYAARQVTEAEAPLLYSVTQELAVRMNTPMPRVYIIPSEAPNAFATGRNPQHAAVAATEGILKLLTRDELTAVMAHELSHVHNRDILISTMAAAIAGTITMIASVARWGFMLGGGGGRRDDRDGSPIAAIAMLILAPIAAGLIQMAISRSREYQADESGAHLCGNPMWLASALRKLDEESRRIAMDANPTTAHLFIVNPLHGGGLSSNLFSTHPPMEARIARLEEMAYGTRRPT
jgi:heat shock protein HtpX